jgi:hypothetical protein
MESRQVLRKLIDHFLVGINIRLETLSNFTKSSYFGKLLLTLLGLSFKLNDEGGLSLLTNISI